jgi:hypothetical protein
MSRPEIGIREFTVASLALRDLSLNDSSRRTSPFFCSMLEVQSFEDCTASGRTRTSCENGEECRCCCCVSSVLFLTLDLLALSWVASRCAWVRLVVGGGGGGSSMLLAIKASSSCANRFLRAFDALFAEVLHFSQLISVTLHRNHLAFCYHPPHYKHIFGSASSSLSKLVDRHTIMRGLSFSQVGGDMALKLEAESCRCCEP